jgi:hypothetical protein
MNSYGRFFASLLFLAGSLAVFLTAAASCPAQTSLAPLDATLNASNVLSPATPPDWALANHADSADAPPPPARPTAPAASGDDSDWHIAISPYLWFTALRGTVGVDGNDVIVDQSAGDLLSHFRFGLMGAVEIRRKWLVSSVDMVWVRLGDDKSIPVGETGEAIIANMKAQEFILTPKIGVRVINQERFKIDAMTGFRFWHLGQSLKFPTSGLYFSEDQGWVDPLVGGRVQLNLTPKVVVNILGDVGGWGTGSQIDYQIAGLVGYRFKPRWIFQVGYRYIGINYQTARLLLEVDQPGVIFGVTWNLK